MNRLLRATDVCKEVVGTVGALAVLVGFACQAGYVSTKYLDTRVVAAVFEGFIKGL